MNKEERNSIVELPIDVIDQFPKHPYKVKDDDDMIQLIESIKENGVITPIIVRPKPKGRYEMISGHRRLQACRHLGHKTVRGQVLELDRNAATVMMVDSNLARSNILPSEKAFAYKMKLDAMKKQGKRTDLTLSPLETKLRSDEQLANDVGYSRAQIQRYIRLTNLIPLLLQMVDEGKIAMRPAVEISYLPDHLQDKLADCILKEDATPSHDQTIRMRKLFKEGLLTEEAIDKIMHELKPNQTNRISLPEDKVKKFMPKNMPVSKREDYILKALEHYDKYLKKQRERVR
ncbi:MAG: ParB/RepB/Spo0J family partition protein [Firmicutes bacterium]|nr:ParB/RepB/Spo0J family partition protein [Bacillota bacterium]